MRNFRRSPWNYPQPRLPAARRRGSALNCEQLERRLMLAAEIDIRNFNGLSITDGDAIPTLTKMTDFGALNVVGGQFIRTFTIANTGNAQLNLTGDPRVQIVGADAADFSVVTHPSATVAAGGSTFFQIKFDPSASGNRTAIITVSSNDSDEPFYDFVVRGLGVAPEIDIRNFDGQSIADGDSTPMLAKQTDFGPINVSAGSFTRTFTIANTGIGPLLLTGNPLVQIGGADAADFAVTRLPNATVHNSGTTIFQVTFDPSSSGNRAAIVTISNNDSDESVYSFTVKGTGIAPEIDILNFAGQSIADGDSAPSLEKLTHFGPIDVAGGSFTRTFTIANTGNGSLNLTGKPLVQIMGADAADFAVTQLPGASINASGTTDFKVTFVPRDAGSRAAIVKVLNNDTNESSYDFVINGVGRGPEISIQNGILAIPDGSSATAPNNGTFFGSTPVTGAFTTQTFTIQNTGGGVLSLLGTPRVQIFGADTADFEVIQQPAATVARGETTSFVLKFDPIAAGSRLAIVKVFSNASIATWYDFVVKGVGVADVPDISVLGQASGVFTPIPDGDDTPDAAQGTNFGSVNLLAAPAVRTFRIANLGLGALNLVANPFVQIVGADAADFAVTTQPGNPIGAGAESVFNVSFAPTAVGIRQAIVKISSDDPDSPFYDFVITGVGLDPTPSNNNFANRISLGASNVVGASGANFDATKEAGEPNHGNNAGGKSVWWTWTAPVAGTVTIDTIGSNYDTTLGVYTGASVNNLTSVAQNDDISYPGTLQSRVTFAAIQGVTYSIAVDGFRGSSTGNVALSGNISLRVNLTPGQPTGGFNITVVFPDNSLNAAQQAVFTTAANRWAQVITGDIPDVTVNGVFIDDVLIEATGPAIDGPGSILGQAGPTHIRNVGSLPARGIMQFDIADIQQLQAAGQFLDVILHEMGHVIGIGTIWDTLGLLAGAGTSNPRFTGANATREYNAIFGVNEASVPVANVGGAGSRDSHWRESVFGAELMSPNLNSNVANPLSRVTVGGLQDLGYVVNYAAADFYSPPGSVLAGLTSSRDSAAGEYEGEMIPLAAPLFVEAGGGIRSVSVASFLKAEVVAAATEARIEADSNTRDYLFESDDDDQLAPFEADDEVETALAALDMEARPKAPAFHCAETFYADLDRSARRKARREAAGSMVAPDSVWQAFGAAPCDFA